MSCPHWLHILYTTIEWIQNIASILQYISNKSQWTYFHRARLDKCSHIRTCHCWKTFHFDSLRPMCSWRRVQHKWCNLDCSTNTDDPNWMRWTDHRDRIRCIWWCWRICSKECFRLCPCSSDIRLTWVLCRFCSHQHRQRKCSWMFIRTNRLGSSGHRLFLIEKRKLQLPCSSWDSCWQSNCRFCSLNHRLNIYDW